MRAAVILAAGFVACSSPHADTAQLWWDPDNGPPSIGRIEYGEVGTLWMVTRVDGVAYVCEILDNGWEGLVEVAFYGDSIGYAPDARTIKFRCDGEWTIKGPGIIGDVDGWRGGRLRIEAELWERET
jgi:hypothetical protein